MTQKWNLQDIRPAETRKKRPVQPQVINQTQKYVTEKPPVDEDASAIVIKDGNKTKKKNYFVLVSVAAVLIVSLFGLGALLTKTTVTVFPVYSEPVVNAEFTAYPDRREGALGYEIITLEESSEKQVAASGEEYVETVAKGFIEIVKTTTGSEKIVKNTRFRSPDGKVFRIQEPVVVPGAIKDSTGNLVPGTIRAEVVADAAGQEYNLPANTKFDVPGFKESNLSELYNSIHAVNRDPISGGFKGKKFIINDNELSTAKQSLELELRDKLLARINNEKPAGFIAFPASVAFTYEDLPTVQYGDNLVTIKEKAVLQMPLFKQDDFANFLAKETIATYNREPVHIVDPSVLQFNYSDQLISSQNLANQTSLTFKISGKPTIVWNFDAEQLQRDLAGKSNTALDQVLTAYPGIDRARATAKPFWKRTFPDNPKEVIIIEVLEEEK